jgi:hypothetical protein
LGPALRFLALLIQPLHFLLTLLECSRHRILLEMQGSCLSRRAAL